MNIFKAFKSFFEKPKFLKLIDENIDCINDLIDSGLYSLQLNGVLASYKECATMPINKIYSMLLTYENQVMRFRLYNKTSNDIYEISPLKTYYNQNS